MYLYIYTSVDTQHNILDNVISPEPFAELRISTADISDICHGLCQSGTDERSRQDIFEQCLKPDNGIPFYWLHFINSGYENPEYICILFKKNKLYSIG